RRPLKMIERSAGALRRDSQIHSGRAEIRGTVDRVEEADVGSIEEVEGLSKDFQAAPLLEREGASYAKINGAKIVTDESVARLDADTVVVAEYVAVGVEAGKLGEAHWRLNRSDEAELIISRENIPFLWRCHCTVQDETIPDIVGRERALRSEVLAVLGDEHEARIWPIVDRFRPGV